MSFATSTIKKKKHGDGFHVHSNQSKLVSSSIPPIRTPRTGKDPSSSTVKSRQLNLATAFKSQSDRQRSALATSSSRDVKTALTSTAKNTFAPSLPRDDHVDGSPRYYTPVESWNDERPRKKPRRSGPGTPLVLVSTANRDSEDESGDDSLLTTFKRQGTKARKGQLALAPSSFKASLVESTARQPLFPTVADRVSHLYEGKNGVDDQDPFRMPESPARDFVNLLEDNEDEAEDASVSDYHSANEDDAKGEDGNDEIVSDDVIIDHGEVILGDSQVDDHTTSPVRLTQTQDTVLFSDSQRGSPDPFKSSIAAAPEVPEEETLYPDYSYMDHYETQQKQQPPIQADDSEPVSDSFVLGDSQRPRLEIESSSSPHMSPLPRKDSDVLRAEETKAKTITSTKRLRDMKARLAQAPLVNEDDGTPRCPTDNLEQKRLGDYFVNYTEREKADAQRQAQSLAFRRAIEADRAAGLFGSRQGPSDASNVSFRKVHQDVEPTVTVIEETDDERGASDFEKSPVKWTTRVQHNLEQTLERGRQIRQADERRVNDIANLERDDDDDVPEERLFVPSSQRFEDDEVPLADQVVFRMPMLPFVREEDSEEHGLELGGVKAETNESASDSDCETPFSQMETMAQIAQMDAEFEGVKPIKPVHRLRHDAVDRTSQSSFERLDTQQQLEILDKGFLSTVGTAMVPRRRNPRRGTK